MNVLCSLLQAFNPQTKYVQNIEKNQYPINESTFHAKLIQSLFQSKRIIRKQSNLQLYTQNNINLKLKFLGIASTKMVNLISTYHMLNPFDQCIQEQVKNVKKEVSRFQIDDLSIKNNIKSIKGKNKHGDKSQQDMNDSYAQNQSCSYQNALLQKLISQNQKTDNQCIQKASQQKNQKNQSVTQNTNKTAQNSPSFMKKFSLQFIYFILKCFNSFYLQKQKQHKTIIMKQIISQFLQSYIPLSKSKEKITQLFKTLLISEQNFSFNNSVLFQNFILQSIYAKYGILQKQYQLQNLFQLSLLDVNEEERNKLSKLEQCLKQTSKQDYFQTVQKIYQQQLAIMLKKKEIKNNNIQETQQQQNKSKLLQKKRYNILLYSSEIQAYQSHTYLNSFKAFVIGNIINYKFLTYAQKKERLKSYSQCLPISQEQKGFGVQVVQIQLQNIIEPNQQEIIQLPSKHFIRQQQQIYQCPVFLYEILGQNSVFQFQEFIGNLINAIMNRIELFQKFQMNKLIRINGAMSLRQPNSNLIIKEYKNKKNQIMKYLNFVDTNNLVCELSQIKQSNNEYFQNKKCLTVQFDGLQTLKQILQLNEKQSINIKPIFEPFLTDQKQHQNYDSNQLNDFIQKNHKQQSSSRIKQRVDQTLSDLVRQKFQKLFKLQYCASQIDDRKMQQLQTERQLLLYQFISIFIVVYQCVCYGDRLEVFEKDLQKFTNQHNLRQIIKLLTQVISKSLEQRVIFYRKFDKQADLKQEVDVLVKSNRNDICKRQMIDARQPQLFSSNKMEDNESKFSNNAFFKDFDISITQQPILKICQIIVCKLSQNEKVKKLFEDHKNRLQ